VLGWWEMTKPTHVDMTKGVYRRIYAGFIDGQRINRLSWMAEAWFWRLLVQADDYGNLKYHAPLMAIQASPRRPVTPDQCDSMVAEIIASGLAICYSVDGDTYLHFVNFEELQPAPRNGRRIARYPSFTGQSANMGNPGESGLFRGNPDASGGVRGNPGELHAPIPIPIPIPIPNPKPKTTENRVFIPDEESSLSDSAKAVANAVRGKGADLICKWIEAYFTDPKGNPLAGAGEMYQARERLVRLLADPWREGTCADFTDDLIGNLSAQTFSTVRQCVNYIEAVCKRCRRDGCLPSDPMKGGKPLQIQRENGTHDAEAEARFAKARAILEAEEQENRR